MAYPDDPGEDLIEKLGRMEDQVRREERPFKLIVLVYVAIAILLGIGMAAVLAAEPEAIIEEKHRGSGVPLHRPDGTTLYVNPNAIAYVRDSLPGEVGNATVVFANGAKQATIETVHEIIEAVEKDRPRTGK